jgi:hypothetical protein
MPRSTSSRLGNFWSYDPIKLILIRLVLRNVRLKTRNSSFGPWTDYSEIPRPQHSSGVLCEVESLPKSPVTRETTTTLSNRYLRNGRSRAQFTVGARIFFFITVSRPALKFKHSHT